MLYYARTHGGREEIDVVAELGDERAIGIEVKADAAPTPASARHLRWMQENLGDRFVAGVLLHTGPRTYALDDRIVTAPICSIWA